MKLHRVILAIAAAALLAPSPAQADVTAFLGRHSASDDRSAVRGFAVGASLLIVGFEFEYASASEDELELRPSLKTTSGNVLLQTFGLPVVQLYLTTGMGIYRERLGVDEETAFALNNGGGAKITLAGPIRARIDYRVFNLKGDPRHSTVQRFYAGVNLAF